MPPILRAKLFILNSSPVGFPSHGSEGRMFPESCAGGRLAGKARRYGRCASAGLISYNAENG